VAATYSPATPPEGWLAAQRDEGYRFSAYKVDVADYADSEWMMQKLLAEFMGRLDVLVNNAGITRDRSLRKMTLRTTGTP
jgi:acetoacetyl-CoA reductase